jgi:tRNA 2-thiocytidine biosynthesis protein TtcA
MKRREIKGDARELGARGPGRTERLFRSLQNVTPSHLADRDLFDFESLAGADD